MSINPTLPVPAHKAVSPAEAKAKAMKDTSAAKADGFSFWDLVDMINPLQHIPIIGTLYREITGDEIKAPARVMGGAVFGGVIGAASGVVNAIMAQETGRDMGEMILSKMGMDIGADKTVATLEPPRAPLDTLPVIEVRPQKSHLASQERTEILYTKENLAQKITWDVPPKQPDPIMTSAPPKASLDSLQAPQAMLQALQRYQELKAQELGATAKQS